MWIHVNLAISTTWWIWIKPIDWLKDAVQVVDRVGNSYHLKFVFSMPYITQTPTTLYLITARVNRKQLAKNKFILASLWQSYTTSSRRYFVHNLPRWCTLHRTSCGTCMWNDERTRLNPDLPTRGHTFGACKRSRSHLLSPHRVLSLLVHRATYEMSC